MGSVLRTGHLLLTGDSADGRGAVTPAQILSLLFTHLLRQLEEGAARLHAEASGSLG